MSDTTPSISPSDQYQIGDDVIYTPAGVRCKIDGYAWIVPPGHGIAPSISSYHLSCGIYADREWIRGDRDIRGIQINVESTPCAESPSPIIKRIEIGPQKTLDGAKPGMY